MGKLKEASCARLRVRRLNPPLQETEQPLHSLQAENSLFAGSDQGGLLAASIYSLLETAKLKGVERSAWRSCTITIAPTTQPAAPPSCCRGIIAQPGPTTSPGRVRYLGKN